MEMPEQMRAAYDELIEAARTARALAITYYASDPEDADDEDVCRQLCEWEEKVSEGYERWRTVIEDGGGAWTDGPRGALINAAMALRQYEGDPRVKRQYGAVRAVLDAVLGI